MSSRPSFEDGPSRTNYTAPYSHNHPVPTIQKYQEHRDEVTARTDQAQTSHHNDGDNSKTKRALAAVKSVFEEEDKDTPPDPYPTKNQNSGQLDRQLGGQDSTNHPGFYSATEDSDDDSPKREDNKENTSQEQEKQSVTEMAATAMSQKQKRKNMKQGKRNEGGQVVTDPITHLPITIKDSTEKDLEWVAPKEDELHFRSRSSTGLNNSSKSPGQLGLEKSDLQEDYNGMQKMFPPPEFDNVKRELERTFMFAFITIAVVMVTLTTLVAVGLWMLYMGGFSGPDALSKSFRNHRGAEIDDLTLFAVMMVSIALIIGFGLVIAIRSWLGNKVKGIWTDEVWHASRIQEKHFNKEDGRLPESTAWINGLIAPVWPLINPELFASAVDMLEDVMQASLPKAIRMISIDDLGQGTESIRILGIRSLPTGAASLSVDEKGNLSKNEKNDRIAQGEGEEGDHDDEDSEKCCVQNGGSDDSRKTQQKEKQKEQERQSIREGMEAEQGDFVNIELAFAYRGRTSGKSLRSKSKNAHLYLKFYLPGGIFVPVWVELRGIIGIMRMRLQLTPDPPFFSLCTMTFLGQPRADISCVPLSKHLPNIMDVPLISSFVQSSIDAALAEYVAPKSLTLDLKDMLVGDDFKKDTLARGVLVIFIEESKGFKEGDGGIGPMKGSSDAYVTCSWAKFGRTAASTRIIEADQYPKWHEWVYLLVTAEELNAEEKVRLQLWDSDKFTADDDLGRVEVDLKDLMHDQKTRNRICEREDRFMGQDLDEKMPGTLSWSVGYFAKKGITEDQLSKQTLDKRIKNKEDLHKLVSKTARKKLREAKARDESKELDQQKSRDYKEREDALLCASSPASAYPSGILSIQIHNITGLKIDSLQKRDIDTSDQEDDAQQSQNLPSSFCTIILNHKKIYKTRTKPKSSKPFFNAGTEKFIRDWKTTEVMISVADSREGENDALLGMLYLPLHKIFCNRSQVVNVYSLSGGIGFGRIRVSMVFRSTETQLPPELLGWDYGTLEIKSTIKAKNNLPVDLRNDRLKLRSNLAKAKMQVKNGEWSPKRGQSSVFLPCRQRYAMPLVIEFRKSKTSKDSTSAFAVFWLKDIPDEEERAITIQVWRMGKENLKKATSCAEYGGVEDDDKPLGQIEVTMKFWRGLSGFHKNWSKKGKNGDVRDVMEVLDAINNEIGDDGDISDGGSDDSELFDDESSSSKPKEMKIRTDQSSSELGNDRSDGDGTTRNPVKIVKRKARDLINGHNDPRDSKRGVLAQAKDYKDHHKSLHRKHRGVMQWQVVRTANWAIDKVKHGTSYVGDTFDHQEKEKGVETEI